MADDGSACDDIRNLLQPYLEEHGLLEDSRLNVGNLFNDIHPVFRPSNFDTSVHVYDTLKPALQLASQFITNEAMLEWWIQAGLGKEVSDPETGQVYLEPAPTDGIKDNIRTIRAALMAMRDCVQFSFESISGAFGHTIVDRERRTYPKPNRIFAAGFTAGIRIRLSDLFEWFAGLYYSDSTTTGCQRLRFNFFFAVNIVHELAHAFGILRRGDEGKEPYHSHADMLSSTRSEMGWSWEAWAFGGQIAPYDDIAAPTDILTTSVPLTLEEAKRGDRKFCPAPMEWIARWFQITTWISVEMHGRKALPPPPRDLLIQLNDHAEWELANQKKRKRSSDAETTDSTAEPSKLQQTHPTAPSAEFGRPAFANLFAGPSEAKKPRPKHTAHAKPLSTRWKLRDPESIFKVDFSD